MYKYIYYMTALAVLATVLVACAQATPPVSTSAPTPPATTPDPTPNEPSKVTSLSPPGWLEGRWIDPNSFGGRYWCVYETDLVWHVSPDPPISILAHSKGDVTESSSSTDYSVTYAGGTVAMRWMKLSEDSLRWSLNGGNETRYNRRGSC